MIVARNNDEAARIARGEDISQLREEPTEAEAAVIAAEAFFEPEAAEAARGRRRRAGRKRRRFRKLGSRSDYGRERIASS